MKGKKKAFWLLDKEIVLLIVDAIVKQYGFLKERKANEDCLVYPLPIL